MVVSTLARTSASSRNALNTLLPSSSAAFASISLVRNSSFHPTVRQLHSVPPIPSVLRNGCAPFLSERTIKQIAHTWQDGLLQRLNDEVRNTEYATASIVETVIGLSQNREKILAFNYASQALNNSFFLSSIAPETSLSSSTPFPRLSTAISKSFGSYPDMCLAFSSAAIGMSGSGWIWLVTDSNRNLGIIPTFGAGTVIVQNRTQQGKGFVLPSINVEAIGGFSSSETPLRPVQTIMTGLGLTESVGDHLYPLLVLSVHEHAWLEDYGIMGKEEYLTRFWNCVNWKKVEERFEGFSPTTNRFI